MSLGRLKSWLYTVSRSLNRVSDSAVCMRFNMRDFLAAPTPLSPHSASRSLTICDVSLRSYTSSGNEASQLLLSVGLIFL